MKYYDGRKPLAGYWRDDVNNYARIITDGLPANHNLDKEDINFIADMLVRSNRIKLKQRLENLGFKESVIKLQLKRGK
jgi:hypothetical protein